MALRWLSGGFLIASTVMLVTPFVSPQIGAGKPIVLVDDSRSVDVDETRRLLTEVHRPGRYDFRLASAPQMTRPSLPNEGLLEPVDRSDVASAVAAVMPEGQAIIVLSDGRFTDASRGLQAPPASLTLVQVASKDAPRISGVSKPWRAPAGSEVDVDISLDLGGQTVPTQLDWRLGSDERGVVPVPVGQASLTVPMTVGGDDAGVLPLTFTLQSTESERILDVWTGELTVAAPPRVALVGASAVAPGLAEAGFLVTQSRPGAPFSTEPDVVVTDRSLAATEAASGSVVRFVEGGGGLVLLGGEASFRLGGWQAERVNAALPVRLPPKPGSGEAFVVVIDRSTSMAEGDRLGKATTGVLRLLGRLETNDQFGAVSFATDARSDVPFGPVTSSARNQARRALRAIEPNGATYIDPALEQALGWLMGSDAVRREVILVTDGELSEGRPSLTPAFDAEAFARRARAAGVTLQAVAIGDRPDVSELEALVAPTGGAVRLAPDGDAIADSVDEAATEQPEAWLVEPVGPVQTQPHPAAPQDVQGPLGAWHQADLKEGASLLASDNEARPLFAAINVGAGRSVAVMAADWSDLTEDVVRSVWWTQNTREEAQVTVESGTAGVARIVIDDAALDSSRTRRWLVRTGGQQLPLVETRPGRFVASLEQATQSPQTVVVTGGSGVRRTLLIPGVRELDPVPTDGVAWVQRHGGTTLQEWPAGSSTWPWSERAGRTYQPFVALSLVFFLAAVALERRWVKPNL